jgi:hypothetical protein
MVPDQAEFIVADRDRFAENPSPPGHSTTRARSDAEPIPVRDSVDTVAPELVASAPTRRRHLPQWPSWIGDWRTLAWFWAAILVLSVLVAASLQMIGPPRPETAQRSPSTSRAGPGRSPDGDASRPPGGASAKAGAGASEPAVLRIPMLLARAEVEIAQGRLQSPAGDNATETLAEVYSLLPAGPSPDRQRADAKMAEISERLPMATGRAEPDGGPRESAVPKPPESARPRQNVSQLAPNVSKATQNASSSVQTTPPAAAATQVSPGQSARSAAEETADPDTQPPIISIHFAVNAPAAEDQAKQVAGRLGSHFDQVEMQGDAEIPRKAIVRFFSSQDHNAARSVGKMLADMGYSWRIDNKSKQGDSPHIIDVVLPPR